MKTIGLLGGISYTSTTKYYEMINQRINEILGGRSSAKIILYSFDFEKISALQDAGRWDELTKIMVKRASDLKKSGADFIAICANTMHKMASNIENDVGIDVLHIAKATADAIIMRGLKKVVLLGTKYVMQGDFYTKILEESGIEVIIPNEPDMQVIHDVIYNELVVGKIRTASKEKYIAIIEKLVARGADGIVLGCTEIPLLIKQSDVSVDVFDTMTIHCEAICKFAGE